MKFPTDTKPNPGPVTPSATAFWERGRFFYNAILAMVVLLWIVSTWPHFRPALTLGSLEAFMVLGLAANLCYCFAYVADALMRSVLTESRWRRCRQVVFMAGTIFAIVLENYWIADEVYPYPNDAPLAFAGGVPTLTAANFASNMNFPAPLAVLGFLGVCALIFLGLAAVIIFWLARKRQIARRAALAIASGMIVYLALLMGFSAASRNTMLGRGQEKYFCEIDCHVAYSVVSSETKPDGRVVVVLRTRFDETTTSPSRPRNAPLFPGPREIRLIDSAGREYLPHAVRGTNLLTPVKPADSYTTELEFNLLSDACGLKLLISSAAAWPDHVVIGDENSWLHKKTYFVL